MDIDERDRFQDLYRGWNRAWKRRPARSFLGEKRLTFVDVSLFETFIGAVLLIPVDVVLIAAKPLPPMPPSPLSSPLAAAVLLLLNAALLGTFLEVGPLFLGWRAGLVLLCSIPWLGLYAFPVRDQWVAERPVRARAADLSLCAPGSTRRLVFRSLGRLWLRELRTSWSFLLYMVANIAVVFWNLWNLPQGSWAVIILALLLHALVAGGLTIHALTAPRQDRADGISLAELPFLVACTLVPIPLFPLAGFVLYGLALSRSSRRALLQPFSQARSSTSHLPRWLELQEALRQLRSSLPWWKRLRFAAPDRAQSFGESHRFLLRVYALKSAALVFDAAAFSWLACWWTEGVPNRLLIAKGLLASVAGLAWLAGVCGLLLMLIRGLQRRFRVEGRLSFLDRHPMHRYLAASMITFAAGLVLGVHLYERDASKLANVLGTMSLYGVAASILRTFFPSPGEGNRSDSDTLWMIGFCLLTILGFSPSVDRGLLNFFTHFYLPVFEASIVVVPILGCAILGVQYLGTLLRPFAPADIRNPAWSRPLRRSLRFLTVTALLPLGGLAVPAWIWIRYRHWPDFEREWQERVPRSREEGQSRLI